MPRYFFDVDDGKNFTIDDVGTELAGPRAAQAEAIGLLPALACDVGPSLETRVLTATVRDERGRAMIRATLELRSEWLGLRLV